MAEYQTGGHAKYDIKYHLVWITKYRYKILQGEVAERARELIRQTCQMRDVQIVRGAVSADHVHMLVSATPHLAPSKLEQYIKRAAVVAVAGRIPAFAEEMLRAAPVGRGYFCTT